MSTMTKAVSLSLGTSRRGSVSEEAIRDGGSFEVYTARGRSPTCRGVKLALAKAFTRKEDAIEWGRNWFGQWIKSGDAHVRFEVRQQPAGVHPVTVVSAGAFSAEV